MGGLPSDRAGSRIICTLDPTVLFQAIEEFPFVVCESIPSHSRDRKQGNQPGQRMVQFPAGKAELNAMNDPTSEVFLPKKRRQFLSPSMMMEPMEKRGEDGQVVTRPAVVLVNGNACVIKDVLHRRTSVSR